MGRVIAISITPKGSEPMVSIQEVRAVAGRGLEGDRYFSKQGTFTENPNTTGRQVTLIEAEAIEALERDYGVKIEPTDARRNIVTSGVPLNHLIDKEFRVGGVRMLGVRLDEPCNHMASLVDETQKDKIRLGLMHRGGLRADILSDGVIRVGDAVDVELETPAPA
ncbi:MAG: MOSC domain-containing protein [Chloroflexi bacterium]|nr:MOSC domain-containing protein [Chloroflexota bacterium]